MSGNYYVYILANRKNGTLYIGITNSLERRVWQHQHKTAPGFTARYGLGRLVYFEQFVDVSNAIAREKQIKAGSRARKIALIERENCEWNDLSAGWFRDVRARRVFRWIATACCAHLAMTSQGVKQKSRSFDRLVIVIASSAQPSVAIQLAPPAQAS